MSISQSAEWCIMDAFKKIFIALICIGFQSGKIEAEPPLPRSAPRRNTIPMDHGYYPYLDREGDVAKLRFICEPNKPLHKICEPLFVRSFVKNHSDTRVTIHAGWSVGYFSVNKMEVLDENNQPVPMTRYAMQLASRDGILTLGGPVYKNLSPAETEILETQPLSVYFDLSKPGRYTATFSRRTIMPGQKYDPHVKYNPIRFHVGKEEFDVGDLVKGGEFRSTLVEPAVSSDKTREVSGKKDDFSMLKFSYKSNKTLYKLSEPVFIQTSVKNNSDSEIAISRFSLLEYFVANKIHVFDEYGQPVPMTRYGLQLSVINEEDLFAVDKIRETLSLKPGEERVLDVRPLSAFFDMSKPGNYNVTFYRRTAKADQMFNPPLKSNSFYIQIDDHMIGMRDLVSPGAFEEKSTEEHPKETTPQKSNTR